MDKKEIKNIWSSSLKSIEEHISPQHFSTWFRPITVMDLTSDAKDGSEGEEGGTETPTLTLEVPNRFFLEWIKENYLELIQDTVSKEAGLPLSFVWKVSEESQKGAKKGSQKAAKKPTKAKKPLKRSQKEASNVGLSPRYTFEEFVIGKANEFAYAACSAVTKDLSSKYNPLFIYGDSGLGKTHLLQAIGHKVLQESSAKVCYYTSERFMNEFITFVSSQRMNEFRNKFRNVDLLLIDDIQFWRGKEGTQEEFFHTFNALYDNHKQIVVTSDQFPKDMDGIEERLRSRFEWGLVADIQPPDTEIKIAILKRKAKTNDINLPDDVAAWLASISGTNIRELEGFLNRITAVSSLQDKEINLEMGKEALKNLLKDREKKTLTIDDIQKGVAGYYNIRLLDLKSKKRHQNIAFPRQIAMYLAREYGKFSYPEIGASFGGKDHSTAVHAVKKIEKLKGKDKEVEKSLKTLVGILGVS